MGDTMTSTGHIVFSRPGLHGRVLSYREGWGTDVGIRRCFMKTREEDGRLSG